MTTAIHPGEVWRQTRPVASVGIIGGGLAGLAAGCALADAGYAVTIFERKPYLGGRASSYELPATGEVVDNCQHVLLGCCTNLIDLYKRLGVEQKVRWYDRLTFIEPGGRSGELSSSAMPAPFHSASSFLAYPLLSMPDKLGVARAMMPLMRGIPSDGGDFLSWLRRHGQTRRAIDRFWAPVLVSALNDDLDRVSVRYGAMVFREAFLKSAEAGRMGVPTVPLSELYGVAADYITARGGEVLLRCSVEQVSPEPGRVVVKGAAGEREFDHAISAVPFHAVPKLFAGEDRGALADQLSELRTVPITGIHLWFDREITGLEHAVLLDRTIQWMFQKSKILERNGTGGPAGAGSYLELVVSSSKTLLDKPRGEILELALRELAEFFPSAREARLLKGTVVKEVHATFSPAPGSDPARLSPVTRWPRVLLSGDWTDTGWPATMEGAVRAGYRTAEVLARQAGRPQRYLVPDLPAQGLMKLFPA